MEPIHNPGPAHTMKREIAITPEDPAYADLDSALVSLQPSAPAILPPVDHVKQARAAHHAALLALHAKPYQSTSGLSMWRALRRLEREVHSATVAQCNGETYQGQPFREYWDPATGADSNTSPWQRYLDTVHARISKVFGGQVPPGFFINQDPRGYALKIRPELVPAGMWKDWGSNGILAAEIA